MLIVSIAVVSLCCWAAWKADAGALAAARFTAMNLCVCWSAHALTSLAFGGAERSRRALWWCVFAFAQIVVTCAALGFMGLLTPNALLAANAAACAGLVAAAGRARAFRRAAPAESDAADALDAFGLAVFAAAAVVCAANLRYGMALPPEHVDDLMHHLRFPVEWMQARRIFICFSPFAFDAPSYAPCDAELFYFWLLAPLRSDVLARVGQFPFFLLAALAAYRLARQARAPRSAALVGACLFVLSPVGLRQSVSANVDLAFAAMFLASVSALADYYRSRRAAALAAFAAALGLMLGTKLFAGLFAVILLAAAAPAVFTRRDWRWAGARAAAGRIAALAVVSTACGGFWYVRNWIATGSALYPMAVKVLGFTVMPGAYDRSVMAASKPVNTEGFAPLLDAFASTFGADFFVLWLAMSAGGAGAALLHAARGRGTARSRLGGALLAWSPWAYFGLLWAALPYYSPCHFLPGFGLACAFLGWTLKGSGAWAQARRAIVLAAVVVHLVPGDTLTRLAPWLTERALVEPGAAAVCAGLVGFAFAAGWAVRRARRGASLLAPLLWCAAAAWAGACAASSCERPPGVRPLVRRPRESFGELSAAWAWARANLRGRTVAFTGNCLVYPLYGPHFSNRLVYVNVDEHAGWKFHDYERYERSRPDYRPPRTEKPGYYRWRPNYDAWLKNLFQSGADILYVSVVPPLEVAYVRPDPEGFPIEREWADAHPDVFQMVFENDRAKVYRIRRPGEPRRD